MSFNTPKIPERNTQNPKYTLEKNFKPFFLKEQPFLSETSESQETLKASYIAFNSQISSSIRKLSSLTNEKPEQVTEKLNYLGSLAMKQTAETLGYNPSEKIEIAKMDLLTIDATLGMLADHINESTNQGQSLSNIQKSVNSFLNKNIDQAERKEVIDSLIMSQSEMTLNEFLGPKNKLFLSTLSEEELKNLVNQLLVNPGKNKDKITHLAHGLPTSNLTLVSTQILDSIKLNPENKSLKDLFKEINSKVSHGEKDLQKKLTNMIPELSRYDFGRGITNLTQNRLFLGLSYVWSTLIFLGNSIQAVALSMGSDRSKNMSTILKSLGLAGAAGSVTGVTGASILTGKPPLKVAENFITKAYNYLTMTKDDVDAMNKEQTSVTVPRLLDQSGPYIAAIFTDDEIIQSISSTNTLIDGKDNLTDKKATEKLNQLHQEIKKKSPQKAQFFENNFLKPSQGNPKQSLLLVYFMQQSYQKSQITNQNSFFKKLKQDPDKYPSIEDFKALENAQ